MSGSFVFDTKLYADSVESFPALSLDSSNCDVYVACGTYQLEESEDGKIHNQNRNGVLYLLRYPEGEPEKTCIHQSWPVTGILDMKWSHSCIQDSTCQRNEFLVLSQANGILSVLRWDHEERRLNSCQSSLSYFDPSKIQLSLDLPSRFGGAEGFAISSTNKGSLEVHRWDHLSETKVDRVIENAHDFEAWTVACNPEEPNNLMASGGDDCRLKLWDLRLDDQSACTVSLKHHKMGVTVISFNPWKAHSFASGSYDETVRIWDDRNLKFPISSVKLGGGIWRMKWCHNPGSHDLLLVAAMHEGFHVLDTMEEKVISSNCQNDHKSLAYGADWLYDRVNVGLVATCSFYDHKFSIWNMNDFLQIE